MSRFLLSIFVLLAIPTVTLASSVIRTGENINIADGQAVEGDFYAAASKIVISGEVTDDLLAAGQSLNINGQVGADLIVIAGQVDINGIILDDARVIAGQVTVSGEVKGDLVVVAETLNVLSTAKIEGDILFFGTHADISGAVGKSILGTSESIRIDGVVGSDIDVKTSELSLGERADITGMVKYTSATEVIRAQNATVAGKVLRNNPAIDDMGGFRTLLIPFLVLLFAALVWYLLFGRMLVKVSAQATNHPLRSMLFGFGIFFLTPIAVGILIMSTLGSLVGITLLFVYFSLIIMTMTIAGIVAGAFLLKFIPQVKNFNILTILAGTTVTFFMVMIPVVGPLVLLSLIFMTMGALATYIYRLVRQS